MATRVKCKHCLGCMIARWVNNSRYYYCDLCRIWYGGGKEIVEVPSPYENHEVMTEDQEQEAGRGDEE